MIVDFQKNKNMVNFEINIELVTQSKRKNPLNELIHQHQSRFYLIGKV